MKDEELQEGTRLPQKLERETDTREAEQEIIITPQERRQRLLWLIFAVLSYFLAYFYVKHLLFTRGQWRNWQEGGLVGAQSLAWGGWFLFAVFFVAGMEAFAALLSGSAARGQRQKGREVLFPHSGESVFWAVCYLAQGAAICLYGVHVGSLAVWQIILWHMTAVYYVLARSGILLEGRTGNLLLFDLAAGFFSVPWGNFLLRIRSLWNGAAFFRAEGHKGKGRRFALAALGSVIPAVLLCLIAWWQLSAADTHFAALSEQLFRWINSFFTVDFWEWFLYFILSLPVGAWLFGLVGGALRKKAETGNGDTETTEMTAQGISSRMALWKKLPGLTGALAMGSLSLIYLLFFGLQIAEFLAAAGNMMHPSLSAPSASEFAVNGFWELCRILLLNFAVLGMGRAFSVKEAWEGAEMRVLEKVFCVFGPLFALFDMAKLFTYVRLYGYTPRRFLAGWFLLLLLFFSVLALFSRFRRIAAVRIGTIAAATAFCALTLFPIETFIVDANMARYESGTDVEVDFFVLGQCRFRESDGVEEYTRLLTDRGGFAGRSIYEIDQLYDGALRWTGEVDENYWESGTARVVLGRSAAGGQLVLTFEDGLCAEAEVTGELRE